jgi:hypothetical protein
MESNGVPDPDENIFDRDDMTGEEFIESVAHMREDLRHLASQFDDIEGLTMGAERGVVMALMAMELIIDSETEYLAQQNEVDGAVDDD